MERTDILPYVGAGTPVGELIRQFWVPAVTSSELRADAPPLRLKLLGEELIAFRTTSGKVGIMDHRCPHRCASLYFGRNEADGIRCIYHGWKFDADGTCLDQPNVDPPPRRISVRAKAYRTVERCGVVWTYMGPRKEPPPLPNFPVFSLPEEQIAVWCEQRECNFMQCVEGELDTSHASFLHLGSAEPQRGSNGLPIDAQHRAVRYKVSDTDYGVMAGGYRPAGEGKIYWRYANFLFPFWTQPPPCSLGTEAVARAWVPMDDTHTMLFAISTKTFSLANHPDAVLPPPQPGFSFDYEFLPNNSDWYGRWRLASNRHNDYRIDRDAQRTASYSGIEGLDIQDMAVQESMGGIVDRSFEHLVASDLAIVRTRRRVQAAAIALRDQQIVPPGVDNPDAYQAWCGYIVAPADADWQEVYSGNTPESNVPIASAATEIRYGN